MGNSSLVWLFMVAIIALGVGGYLYDGKNPFGDLIRGSATTEQTSGEESSGNEAGQTSDSSSGTSVDVDVSASVSANTVRLTSSGFSPSTITVKKGSTVTFVNQTHDDMWVASAQHPTHTMYSGTSLREHCPDASNDSFDQCETGDTFTFTFDKAGSWNYHNHVEASEHGTIVVTD